MRTRLAVLAVVPLLAVLSSTSGAAPKPQVVDAKGDAAGGQASLDIVSVAYTTTGIGTGKGYTPKKLVVTLTLAAPPSSPGVSYTVSADTDTCGVLESRFAPGNATASLIGDTYATFGSCAESVFHFAKVKGNQVSFEYALKAIDLDRGTQLFDFRATVNVIDPALGSLGTDANSATDGVLDTATGKGTWRVP